MTDHPLRHIIEACDRAITAQDYDSLMQHYADDAALVIQPGHVVHGKDRIRQAFAAIAAHFDHKLVVTQGEMQVIEGAGTALVIMETHLQIPAGDTTQHVTRRATYVFRHEPDGQWRCTVDNSYGTALLNKE
ncbi:YybH family protein [Pseudomonadota bacterium AL_CKDN230030165-1A_HGKHYDSX7]